MSDATTIVVEQRAHAKINLSLDVLGRRPDGYHELRSVMQSISLHDTLTLRLGNLAANIHPPDSDFSLIDRAIAAVCEASGFSADISYTIDKQIPVAAGLGGGSADAAAALRATCRLISRARREGYSSGSSPDPTSPDLGLDLHSIAASLGSDVPFFLTGGTCLIEGRGERITPLPDAVPIWVLLAADEAPVSTRAVFDAVTEADRGDGLATKRVLDGLASGLTIFGGNDLTRPAIRQFPAIRQTIDILKTTAPPERIAMSGSGGTVVALFDSPAAADQTHHRLEGKVPWLKVAESINRAEAVGIKKCSEP
jgi:4-diphosphocytidyl-2-C-methyl-D-erythritol kinase